jgi:hypothetical protein
MADDDWIDQLIAEDAERFRSMLARLLSYLGITGRDLDRRIGLGRGYTANVLSGRVDMKQRHVSAILAAAGIHPNLFFNLLYPPDRPFGHVVMTEDFARRLAALGLLEPPKEPPEPLPPPVQLDQLKPFVQEIVRQALAGQVTAQRPAASATRAKPPRPKRPATARPSRGRRRRA